MVETSHGVEVVVFSVVAVDITVHAVVVVVDCLPVVWKEVSFVDCSVVDELFVVAIVEEVRLAPAVVVALAVVVDRAGNKVDASVEIRVFAVEVDKKFDEVEVSVAVWLTVRPTERPITNEKTVTTPNIITIIFTEHFRLNCESDTRESILKIKLKITYIG